MIKKTKTIPDTLADIMADLVDRLEIKLKLKSAYPWDRISINPRPRKIRQYDYAEPGDGSLKKPCSTQLFEAYDEEMMGGDTCGRVLLVFKQGAIARIDGLSQNWSDRQRQQFAFITQTLLTTSFGELFKFIEACKGYEQMDREVVSAIEILLIEYLAIGPDWKDQPEIHPIRLLLIRARISLRVAAAKRSYRPAPSWLRRLRAWRLRPDRAG